MRCGSEAASIGGGSLFVVFFRRWFRTFSLDRENAPRSAARPPEPNHSGLFEIMGRFAEIPGGFSKSCRRVRSRPLPPHPQEGLPFSYETFNGNRSDVSTMETILRMVERKYGKARRIRILDRGIVSEKNLAAIRKRDGQYLTGKVGIRFAAQPRLSGGTGLRQQVVLRKSFTA
jgi:hypothetical protein